ncbi:vasculin-like isoform X1 [Aythya fuligula]|uniref:Vasculin n=1 Tax=Aythya fuligula TaxID=219594 RepID=A0A6J3ELR8_AYTFU|nr:vasculin-like isoform X1 [Aythya fuligula]XP_032062841.1 vasculin-like isoform X1 [Aythya fuligula]XP_032062842.1 vasculin-like isoform X1 [Aythya fuligula]XP_032062843.1 vasculin-like isoform X1 [Aythya fuligula]XP_032062844.1 vasculin-like isoform X1 [Aythya fuligula]XP_032062845.1 vasculin-like isoform X1 [Aythya fuligula]XP_032062846.1 vasculin-like isoform X1 [Aythya fuligula]XP_032062847.1 vasculin-like isoform X1 [Aythya fuligula]XP_032062849.1 vasculin-like isoform X1 [Aythya ful
MAQHDFAPAWLNFPTPPSSTKSSLNFERHSENILWTENRYEVNRRRRNSSDGLDSNVGRHYGGHFRRKEKNGWRSQGRNGTENINYRGGYHGEGSRAHTSPSHCGKSQGLHENNVPDNDTGKKEDKEVPKQFEAEDFPSLNPEYEREPNQNKSLAAGVWEYPLNPKSRSSRMLVIKKGSTKELQISGFPLVGSLHLQTVKNGTGTSVYKGLVPKPATPPAKTTQWKSQAKENKTGIPFPLESTYGIGNFSPFKSNNKAFPVSQNSVKECNQSNSSSPVDKVGQPHLTKLTRMRTDKKSEFLKALKQRVEEHEDENHAGREKDDSFNLHNSNSPRHERYINQNFENEIPQENGNASVTSQLVIRSSTFPQADVLSSSLEAEHRLLKEMGWQEESENDETCAPLTEDEMREFQAISEQLQKNGLRKNGILKNGLICDFKFSPWKNSTFQPALENDDSETSSSDTSDDDDV